jgi:lipopolysaccharide exporter
VTQHSDELTKATPPASGVRSSALWNLGQFGSGKAVSFISTMVLARLLAPEDFGLLALGLLAINVFDRVKDIGVGSAVIQHPGPLARLAPSATSLTVATSVVIALTGLVTAPLWASLLGDQRLVPIVRALSAALLVSGLAVFPDSVLRRRLLFRRRAIPEIGGAAVKAVVSISLALAGLGVWSLVWGQLAAAVFSTTSYWLAYLKVHADRPLLGWSSETVRHLVRYGMSISVVALLALILDNLDYFSIGRRLGAEQLGYYTVAFRLPELLVISVCQVIGQVMFASFSRQQHDMGELRQHYLKATSTVAALMVPIGLGLSAAAPDIVTVVLGKAFQPAAPLLALLSLYATLIALVFQAGEVYKATGRAYFLIWLAIAKMAVFLPALWLAAGRSTLAVAIVFVSLHAVSTMVNLLLIRHVISLRLHDQWKAYWPPLLAGGVMAGCVVLLRTELLTGIPALPRLALMVCSGALIYLGLLRILDPAALRRATHQVHIAGVGGTDDPK